MTRAEIQALIDDLDRPPKAPPERTDWFSVACFLLIFAIVAGVLAANFYSLGVIR